MVPIEVAKVTGQHPPRLDSPVVVEPGGLGTYTTTGTRLNAGVPQRGSTGAEKIAPRLVEDAARNSELSGGLVEAGDRPIAGNHLGN
jgi:hypothetical protein